MEQIKKHRLLIASLATLGLYAAYNAIPPKKSIERACDAAMDGAIPKLPSETTRLNKHFNENVCVIVISPPDDTLEKEHGIPEHRGKSPQLYMPGEGPMYQRA